jgi:hypothetical protein
MNNSKSYPTWIKSDDNSDAGITVYSVACYLSQGIQADVFAFEPDAYLSYAFHIRYLVSGDRQLLRVVRRPGMNGLLAR